MSKMYFKYTNGSSGSTLLLGSLYTLLGTVLVRSPKKSLRTMLRLYQARGNAKISVKRLMSYLNEADPMSTIAKEKYKDSLYKV